MKFGKWFLNNFALKLIALILSLVTWFYVFNKLEPEHKPELPKAKLFPTYGKLLSRKLYIKAIFFGDLPERYELDVDKVKLDPSYFIVAGPNDVLKGISKLETEPIDISKYKKTTIFEANIAPLAPGIDTESMTVTVSIRIYKKEV